MFITLFGTRGGIALYLLSHYMGRPEQLSSSCVSYVITSTTRLVGASEHCTILPVQNKHPTVIWAIVFYLWDSLLQSSSFTVIIAMTFTSDRLLQSSSSSRVGLLNTYPENLRSNSTLYRILLVFYEFSNYFITLHCCISVYVSKSDHRLSK